MKFVKLNWKTVLSFLVGVLVLYFLITQLDLKYASEIIRKIKLHYFLTAFVVYYLGFLVRAERWRSLLRNNSLKGGLWEFTRIYYLSFFINSLVPAKVGDLYRSHLTRKCFKFSPSKVFATVIVERMSDIVFAIFVLTLYAFFLFPAIVPKGMVDFIIIVYIILIVVFISFWFVRRKKKFFLGLLPKKISKVVYDFGHTITSSIKLKNLPRLIVLTSVIWFIEFLVFYFIFRSLNLGFPFYLIIFITLLAAVLSSVPITPAGLGAVEAGTAGFLILFGLDKNFAITSVFLVRLINYWSIVVIGAVVYFLSKKR